MLTLPLDLELTADSPPNLIRDLVVVQFRRFGLL